MAFSFLYLFLRHKRIENYINEMNDKELKNKYEKLLKYANDIIIISDEIGNIKFMNDKALIFYGFSKKESLKLNIKDIRSDSQIFNLEEFRRRALDPDGSIFETLHKNKNGTIIPVEVSVQMIDLEGEIFAQELIRDITKHKESQKKIIQLNRVYSVLSNINQMIVRVKDKAKLFSETCKIAVNNGGFTMSWIGIIDTASRQLMIVSSAGFTNNYLDNLKIDLNWPDNLTGLSGRCIKSGKYQICNDIEKDPLSVRSTSEAFKNNYQSVATFPIRVQDKIIGVINLYSIQKDFFTTEEISLLDEMAHDISYAIEYLENETIRKKTEDALKDSEEKMKVIIEGTPHLFFYVQDSLGNIKYISPSVEKMTGHTIKEWQKRKDWFITNDEINKNAINATNEHLKGNFSKNPVQLQIRHAEGNIIYLEAFEYPIKENDKIIGLQGVAHDITEKIKMENDLKESEERWNFALKGSNDGVWDWNLKTNIVFFSKRWKEMLGYQEDEIKNRLIEWEKRVHPDDKENVFKNLYDHLSGKTEYYIFEYRMINKDGDNIWILDRGKVMSRDHEGKPIRMVGTHTDISETKLVEENLKFSEEKYRTLFENSMVGIYRTTPNGQILLANPAMLKMLGYSSMTELASRNLKDEGYEPSYERNDFIAAVERNDKVIGFESAWKKINGEYAFIKENAQAIRDENGKTLYYDGIVEDITKQVKATEEINKLSRAVEQSPVSIMITDINGNLEYVNPKFCELSGYQKNEVIGKNPRFLKSDHTSQEEYKELWETISSGKQWHGEFLDKMKDGSCIWESTTISPILNSAGKITHYLAVKEDISERKAYESELHNAKEKAEEMNLLKSNFLANMSHELRTPMIGILGFSELLIDSTKNPYQKEMAETIYSSGKRLLDTLNLLLDLAKLESNKLEIRFKTINVSQTIEEALKNFEGFAATKNLYLKSVVKKDVYSNLDERIFIQIINNLINNALKFTEHGGITVEVDLKNIENSSWSIIKVIDTGIGIPKESLDLIFEEFRQVSEGYNRHFEGTGLGLTLTKRSVELMNGSISVESEVGKGSTFIIKFPSIQSEGPKKVVKKEKQQASIFDEPTSMKILVVDNDTASINYLNYILNKYFTVDIANDGKNAINLASKNSYNLILMDIGLGFDMNGIEATQEIRKISGYEKTPIIAVTAYATKEDEKEFLSKGLTHYISKPFTGPEILKLIKDILNISK